MKRFFYYIRLYAGIISQYIKARMQYRADFIIGFAGMIFHSMTSLLTLWVLFNTIPVLADYTLDELIFMYGFALLANIPLQLFFDNIWQLRRHLMEGTFIKYYFRPVNMLFYYISEVFDLKGLGQVLIAIATIVYASVRIPVAWDPLRLLLFVALLLSASLVMLSLMMIAAFSGFWLLNSFSIMNLVSRFREISRYPLTIFNSVFRFIFTFLIPIGFIAYYPLQLFFHATEVPVALWFSPLVGIGMFVLAVVMWNRGIHTYSGTGS